MEMFLTGIVFLIGLVLVGFAVGYSFAEQAGYREGFAAGLGDEEEVR